MSENQLYQRNEDIIATEMDGSLMMMSVEQGKYFELNPVSKRIWEILENPHSKSNVVAVLMEEYDVSLEQCNKEVSSHLDILIQNNIALKI